MAYGSQTVLDSLDWRLMPGEHWAITGRNGAGKTSLLKLLRGEIRPFFQRDGAPLAIAWAFDGAPDTSPLAVRPVSSMLSSELQRHYVRQGWQLSGEDVILSGFGDGYMLYDRPSPDERDAVYALAARLGAAHLLDALAPDMSQGQLRLVLLARALVKKPLLLLLDEPCDGLDAESQKNLFSMLDEICNETSIVCAIHKGEDIPDCLTHALELEAGKIVKSGPLEREAMFAAENTSAMHIHMPSALEREGINSPCSGLCEKTPLNAPQNQIAGSSSGAPANGSEIVFRLQNADVYLKRKKILHGLNWEVKNGENWLLSGPNGSGKTTLLRVLLGEEHVALGGSLRWFGRDEHEKVTLEERQRYTGYVSDWLRNIYQYDLTGRELVLSGLMGSIGFYRQPLPHEEREADYWLELMGLGNLAAKRFDAMSEGMARRFLLARALAPRPKLLILDEPCSGLDGAARADFMRRVPLAAKHGSQIIFVSHSKADLAGIGHILTHELGLKDGKIEYCGIYK